LAEGRPGLRAIAINRSWQLIPWADCVYGTDFAWWQSVGGLPEFRGLKLCGDRHASRLDWGVEWIRINGGRDALELLDPARVGWGGNSGYGALNFALHHRPRRILLVGYDMSLERGVHWHGKHKATTNPIAQNVLRWRHVIEAAAPVIAGLGIEVINCSSASALQNYPTATLEEALAC
jgi:hypothetical protein